ncbi:MAG: hypothetical protein ABEJ73_01605 [Haloplanus sp.]
MSHATEAPATVSDLVAVPVLFVTLGAVGVYTGWKRRHIHAQMSAAESMPIRELSSPGVVEIDGTATPVDGAFAAPITGRDAVVAAWTVEEWDERGDTSRWREVARGVEAPAFEVDDGTAAVAVDHLSKRETAEKWTQTTGVSAETGVRIDDVLAEFDSFPVQATVGPDEEPPEGIRRLHDDHDLYADTGSVTNAVDIGRKHGRRRYTEGVVAPDESVYVLGRVEARDDPDRARIRPDDAVVTTPADGLFVVSNQDEATLESKFDTAARTRLIAGAVAVVAGLGGLAYLFVPV